MTTAQAHLIRIALLALLHTLPAAATVWHVAENGDDLNGDGSSAAPWATIPNAIDKASAGDTILLAAGTYTQTSAINVSKSLTIQGAGMEDTIVQAHAEPRMAGYRVFGFSHTGYVVLRHMTIRHGSVSGGTSVPGSAVQSSGQGASLTLDGCRVTANHVEYDATTTFPGGAVHSNNMSGDPQVIVLNCEIVGNSASRIGRSSCGAGVGSRGGALIVSNTLFQANSNPTWNAGLAATGSTRVFVYDSTFVCNTGHAGVAVNHAGTDGSLTIERTTFDRNASFGNGAIRPYRVTSTLANCTFDGNEASGNGGAIYVEGRDTDPTLLYNCTVAGNEAARGGGIYVYSGDVKLRGTLVAGNVNTGGDGPDIYLRNSDYATVGTTFSLVGNNDDSGLTAGLPNDDNSYVGTPANPVDPGLLPLADNGGLTQTRALAPGSLAVNRGDPANPYGLTTDQRGRGYARVIGSAPDIGAYELGAGVRRETLVIIR